MPVRRLRNLQQAEDNLWRDPDDPKLYDQIRSLWRMSARLAPKQFPPGVYKHRSIEQLNRQTEAWEEMD